MNFLALAQKLVEKSGMSGNGPVSVAGQTGEMKRAVNWINEAWLNIQEMREDWDWMRGSVSFQTVAQKATYTAQEAGIDDLAEWLMNTSVCTFRIYDTDVGVRSEIFLSYINYDSYRDTHMYGNMRVSYGRPIYVTVTPDMSIGLGQIPDTNNYTIVGDYFKTPSQMTSDTDVPALPSRFHMAIVYLAMVYYGEFEQDDYVRQTSKENFNAMLSRMNVAQLPEMAARGALA